MMFRVALELEVEFAGSALRGAEVGKGFNLGRFLVLVLAKLMP